MAALGIEGVPLNKIAHVHSTSGAVVSVKPGSTVTEGTNGLSFTDADGDKQFIPNASVGHVAGK